VFEHKTDRRPCRISFILTDHRADRSRLLQDAPPSPGSPNQNRLGGHIRYRTTDSGIAVSQSRSSFSHLDVRQQQTSHETRTLTDGFVSFATGHLIAKIIQRSATSFNQSFAAEMNGEPMKATVVPTAWKLISREIRARPFAHIADRFFHLKFYEVIQPTWTSLNWYSRPKHPQWLTQ